MQTILLIFAGAGAIGCSWLGYLIGKHGLGWVLAWLRGRAGKAEAKFQAKIAAALPGELAKLGIAFTSTTPAEPPAQQPPSQPA